MENLRKVNTEDLLTGENLDGAVFRLEKKISDTEWELVGEYTSDSNGSIDINNLTYGIYKLKEIKAPEGYNLNKENAEVGLEINESNANYELTVTYKVKTVLPETGRSEILLVMIFGISIIMIGLKVYMKK